MNAARLMNACLSNCLSGVDALSQLCHNHLRQCVLIGKIERARRTVIRFTPQVAAPIRAGAARRERPQRRYGTSETAWSPKRFLLSQELAMERYRTSHRNGLCGKEKSTRFACAAAQRATLGPNRTEFSINQILRPFLTVRLLSRELRPRSSTGNCSRSLTS
jgi:hypothetical protein